MRYFYCVGGLSVLIWTLGCGQIQNNENPSKESTPETSSSPESEKSGLSFRGAVVSAFEVTVDGQSYGDMEQFYTAELSKLATKVKEAGYSSATNVRFDAELGFLDLWRSMNVFLLAEGDQGYMSSGVVDSSGTFTIALPDDASEDSYQVRANKRIKVKFLSDGATKTFCYNFSAVQQKVSFAARSKPILLKTFESSLTAYDCPADAAVSSLQIPAVAASTEDSKISKSMTKAQVSVALGVDGLSILDTANWCYTPAGPDTVCDIAYTNVTCRCSLQFDESGQLKAHSNVNPKRLNQNSWVIK